MLIFIISIVDCIFYWKIAYNGIGKERITIIEVVTDTSAYPMPSG